MARSNPAKLANRTLYIQPFENPAHIVPVAKSSRRHKSTGDLHPLRNTASLFALDVDNISVASASAAHAVLLLSVPLSPVVVVFFEEFLVLAVTCRALLLKVGSEVGFAWQLTGRSVGGTVLDCGVAVAEVAEVVNV
jgi:hypothetical protein